MRHLKSFQTILALYLLLTGLYAGLGYLDKPQQRVVPVDSAFYYMYLRSVFFDGDIDFSNEVRRVLGEEYLTRSITATGMAGNQWSIGPALCWTPFFLVAHGATLVARALGADLALDGYSALYTLSVYLANSLYLVAGFFFLLRALRRFLSERSALLAVVTLLLASQVTYYLWPLTAMAHNTAFFASCLLLERFLATGVSASTVLAGALLFLTRWQAVIYLTPVLFSVAAQGWEQLQAHRRTRDGALWSWLGRQLALAGLFALAVFPQLLVWKVLYGSFFVVPHGGDFISLSRLRFGDVLFSLHRGLFAWHPALLAGVAGLALLWRQGSGPTRRLALACAAAVAAQLFLVASLQCWWAGWAFGQRFFIESLPMLAMGLGLVWERAWPRRGTRLLAVTLLVLLGVWNQLFIYQ